jgi:hypothetical protein
MRGVQSGMSGRHPVRRGLALGVAVAFCLSLAPRAPHAQTITSEELPPPSGDSTSGSRPPEPRLSAPTPRQTTTPARPAPSASSEPAPAHEPSPAPHGSLLGHSVPGTPEPSRSTASTSPAHKPGVAQRNTAQANPKPKPKTHAKLESKTKPKPGVKPTAKAGSGTAPAGAAVNN